MGSQRVRGTPAEPFSAMAPIAAICHPIEGRSLWGVGLSHDGGLMAQPKRDSASRMLPSCEQSRGSELQDEAYGTPLLVLRGFFIGTLRTFMRISPLFPFGTGIGHRHTNQEHERWLDHIPNHTADPRHMLELTCDCLPRLAVGKVFRRGGKSQSVRSDRQHNQSAIGIE